MTRYPNLLAEYEAGTFGHISTLCRRANVTEELMKAVLYGGAELTAEEIENIGNKKYISDPELQYIDGDDKIERFKLERLAKWYDEVETAVTTLDTFARDKFEKVKRLVRTYRAGEKITVAVYRAGINGETMVRCALEPKKPPRTVNDTVANRVVRPLPGKQPRRDEDIQQEALTGIDSREVAQMIGKEHSHLLRDIETYITYMSECQNPKLDSDVFFIKGSYVAGTGKQYKCYLLTRKGCEFVANKLTGQKGTLFTAAYINRFHEMEHSLKQTAEAAPKPNPDTELLEKLLCKIESLEKQISEINHQQNAALLLPPETSAALDPLFLTPVLRYTTTAIGKAFGISARALNRFLLAQDVHRPEGSGWVLNKKYADCNYAHHRTGMFTNANGEKDEKRLSWWTAEGMEFVRLLLTNAGLKQKYVIEPYSRHGKKRGKRKSEKSA